MIFFLNKVTNISNFSESLCRWTESKLTSKCVKCYVSTYVYSGNDGPEYNNDKALKELVSKEYTLKDGNKFKLQEEIINVDVDKSGNISGDGAEKLKNIIIPPVARATKSSVLHQDVPIKGPEPVTQKNKANNWLKRLSIGASITGVVSISGYAINKLFKYFSKNTVEKNNHNNHKSSSKTQPKTKYSEYLVFGYVFKQN